MIDTGVFGMTCLRLKRERAGHMVQKSLIWLVRFIVIVGICFLVILPLISDVSMVFREERDFYDPSVVFISKHFTLDNLKLVAEAMNLKEAAPNTIGLSLLVAVSQLISCSFIGYGFAKFRFKGSRAVFACVVLTLIVPSQILMSPLFLQFSSYNPLSFLGVPGGICLNNTIWPVFLMSITGVGYRSGIYIYLLRQFFRGIPRELDEAAMLDGATRFKIFYGISLPSARPILVTVFLFAFVWQWTDVTFSGTFLYDTPLMSINAGNIQSILMGSMPELADNQILTSLYTKVAAVILIVPIMLLFIILQRFFTQSIERTGLVR